MSKSNKSVLHELWTLFCLIDHFSKEDISICGGNVNINELILHNKRCGFMSNFQIDDIKTIRRLNALLLMWINNGADAQCDNNGNDIFTYLIN